MSNLIGDMYLSGVFGDYKDEFLLSAYSNGLLDSIRIMSECRNEVCSEMIKSKKLDNLQCLELIDRFNSEIKEKVDEALDKLRELQKRRLNEIDNFLKRLKEANNGQSSAGGDVDVGLLECTG